MIIHPGLRVPEWIILGPSFPFILFLIGKVVAILRF